MFVSRLKAAGAVLAAAILAGAAVVGVTRPVPAEGKPPAPAPPPARPAENAKEVDVRKELEGAWTLVTLEGDGETQSLKDQGVTWKFRGPLVHVSGPDPDGKQNHWCVAQIDPAKNPGHFDLIALEGDLKGELKTTTLPGLYRLAKGRLVLCLRNERRTHLGRPADFTADPKGDQAVFTFEKAKDPPTLAGTYELKEMYVGGSTLNTPTIRTQVAKEGRVVFSDAAMTIESPRDGRKRDTRYTLDPSKDPKEVAFSKPDGTVASGIYEFDSDTLRLCVDEGAKASPPKEFAARESRHSLWVLKRVKTP